MSPRISCVIVALALTVTLGGCAPEPRSSPSASPSPSPSQSLSSEAEAFAAAEKTYRAYVDALNQVDLSDPETFEPVFALTTGDTNNEARRSLSQMHVDHWTVRGSSRVTLVVPVTKRLAGEDEVSLAVCLDVSGVELWDEDRISMVDADRPNVQTMLVGLTRSNSAVGGWLIASITGRDGAPACV